MSDSKSVNPFESPQVPTGVDREASRERRFVVISLSFLLTPAIAIAAFFAGGLATQALWHVLFRSRSMFHGLGEGIIAGSVCAIVAVVLTIKLTRRHLRSLPRQREHEEISNEAMMGSSNQ